MPTSFLLTLLAVSMSTLAVHAADGQHRASTSLAFSPKVERYASRLLAAYDVDQNGRLESEEWQQLRGDPARIDRDGDGEVTRDELAAHVFDYGRSRRLGAATANQGTTVEPSRDDPLASNVRSGRAPNRVNSGGKSSPATESSDADRDQRRRNLKFYVSPKRLPSNLPSWFLDRDKDGDAQLTLSEFTAGSGGGRAEEFRRLDGNRDGLVTAQESVAQKPKR